MDYQCTLSTETELNRLPQYVVCVLVFWERNVAVTALGYC